MYGRFAFYTEPAKVARILRAVTPQGVKWLSPGREDPDELQSLLKPARKGKLDHYPVSRDVGKFTYDGDYLLDLNIE
jgi:putative SOS response-associated peptidase YedK